MPTQEIAYVARQIRVQGTKPCKFLYYLKGTNPYSKSPTVNTLQDKTKDGKEANSANYDSDKALQTATKMKKLLCLYKQEQKNFKIYTGRRKARKLKT